MHLFKLLNQLQGRRPGLRAGNRLDPPGLAHVSGGGGGGPSSLLTGLLTWYTLNDASNIVDAEGNGPILTNLNSFLDGVGLKGNAADMEVDNSQAATGTDDIFKVGGNDFTIAFYTNKETSQGGSNRGAASSWETGQRQFVVSVTTLVELFVSTNGSNAPFFATGPGTIVAGTWHSVVCTFKDSTTTGSIIIDDSTPVTNNFGASMHLSTNGVFDIGRFGVAGLYDGRIDEVALWNRVLTPAEITEYDGIVTHSEL